MHPMEGAVRGGTTPDGMLLCLIGGFLALLELQAEIDGSASVAGVVVTAAD